MLDACFFSMFILLFHNFDTYQYLIFQSTKSRSKVVVAEGISVQDVTERLTREMED